MKINLKLDRQVMEMWQKAKTFCQPGKTGMLGGVMGGLALAANIQNDYFQPAQTVFKYVFFGVFGGFAGRELELRMAERALQKQAEKDNEEDDDDKPLPRRASRRVWKPPVLGVSAAEREELVRWDLMASPRPFWRDMADMERRVMIGAQQLQKQSPARPKQHSAIRGWLSKHT